MPTAVIHHDRRYVSPAGLSPVKIKVTFKVQRDGKSYWIRKFYGEGFHCTQKQFKSFFKPNSPETRVMMNKVMALRAHAHGILENNPFITLAVFESKFFGRATGTVSASFENCIADLRKAERIGTATSYSDTLSSMRRFVARVELAGKTDKDVIKAILETCEIRFSDISSEWLQAYQDWMIKRGRSINTIGIHLRTLRAIFNQAVSAHIVPAELYPFGAFRIRSESKFKIPLSKNELRALKAYNPKLEDRAAARDYFLFSYYCNGMNMVDLCRLRHSDIQDDFIIYDRSKTRSTKINFKKIVIPMGKEIAGIILRRGRSLDPKGYVFPVLENDLSALTIKSRVQNFIRLVNASLKGVASDLKFTRKLTTVIARHTFANRMSNSGADRRMIQEQLGHQVAATTEHYLGTMDIERIRSARKKAL